MRPKAYKESDSSSSDSGESNDESVETDETNSTRLTPSQDNLEEPIQQSSPPRNASEDDVGRQSVIQHEGQCCSSDRQRRVGRSAPGRQINRHQQVQGKPPPPGPLRLVEPGDVIQYFTGWIVNGQEEWLRATIRPMTAKAKKKHPDYYNVVNEKGEEKSIKLVRGGAWAVLRDDLFYMID